MYSEENISSEDVRKLVKELIPGGRLITPKSIHPEGDYRCYVLVPLGNKQWCYLHQAPKLFELANILTKPGLDPLRSSIGRGPLSVIPIPFPMEERIKKAERMLRLFPEIPRTNSQKRERREWETELKELRGEM